MDIRLVITRATLFVMVYLFVLGIPLLLGYRYRLWEVAIWTMLLLATLGPFIFIALTHYAESRLLKEQRRAHQVLGQATEGMMRIRDLNKLLSLIEHVTSKALKLENTEIFLLDEARDEFKLAAIRLRSKHNYLEAIKKDDPLIKKLADLGEPLVYEEIKQKAQELKNSPNDPIHEIESQMQKLSAAVILPAVSRGRLLGFMVLGQKKSGRMYTKEDLTTLWVLSYQAALAIENALFWQKEEQRLIESSNEEAVSAVTFGAGHQFNNRLYSISMVTDCLLEALKDISQLGIDDSKALLNKITLKLKQISEECQFGGQITAGIMSLTGSQPKNFKAFDLFPIIASSIEFVEMKHSRDKIESNRPQVTITNHISQSLPLIFGSDAQIRDCLFNVIDNAFDAGYEKYDQLKGVKLKDLDLNLPENEPYSPLIEINALVKDEYLLITVTDNGMGMKEEDSKKLFAGYFTTKATSVKGYCKGGHGIGMFTVKKLISAHKGKIYFTSEYGKGTTFTMELPLAKKENKENNS